ncbi:MAG: ABC transporter substrate-binding protein [Aminivibrio sp.]|jgi:peptide/nickel transport system substrate-binding protein
MKKTLFALLLMVIFLTPGGVPEAAGSDFDPEAFAGPKIKDLYLVIIRDPDAQLMALQRSKVDILGDLHRPVDVDALSKNPEVELSLASGFHGFFLGFNTRSFPWNSVELRRSAWQALPKDRMVRDLFAGYAEPLSTFLPPVSPYFEPEVTAYPFDPEAARKRLSDAGWTWGSDGVLLSPEGEKIPPQKLLSPTASSAPTTAEIAVRIAEALSSIGIPVEAEPMDFSAMISRLDERDFQMYVLAWQMSRDPDSLYAFYSSKMDVRGGYNMPGISDPELDEVLDRLRFAPDEEEAGKAASEAQKALSDLVPVVPIYSRYYISAVSKEWKGTLVTDRATADNTWSLLAMEPAEGPMKPLYLVQQDEPRALNPFTSSSAYDWQVMGLIYDSLIAVDPYTLSTIPWLAESWTVETEDGPSGARTVLTFRIREGVEWHDGKPLTADDVAFTYETLRKFSPPRYLDAVDNMEAVETPDGFTVRVIMKNVSFWHLHRVAGIPVLPRHVVEKVEDWRSWLPAEEKSPSGSGLTGLVGSGPFVFREYRPGEYVRMSANEQFWLGRKK